MPKPTDYVKHGWVLCPIPRGAKGPTAPGWQLRDRAVDTVSRAQNLHENVGLCHAYSGTCAVDLDDVEAASAFLLTHAIDVKALLNAPDAVRIESGRPNRAKLLYRLPAGVEPLPSRKLAGGALELRCGTSKGTTAQDALPPSVHPGTGAPYRWEYGDELLGSWRSPPELPAEILALWRSLLEPARDQVPAPTGAGADELRELLAEHDPDCGYDDWVRVGMALHHECDGSDEGLALWNEWSASGGKYLGIDDLESHWRSFGHHPDPVTLGSLYVPRVASVDDFEDLTVTESLDLVASIDADKVERYRFLPVPELRALPRPTWLIKDLLPVSDVGTIYGRPGGGKTFIALDLCFAVALGRDWRDLGVTRGGVLYVAAEDDAGVRLRIDAYLHERQVDPDTVPLRVLCDAPNFLNQETQRSLRIAVRDAAEAIDAKLIVVDTLASVTAGADENSSKDMTVLVDYCKQLHKDTGAVVLLVHHEGKTDGRGPRGSSALHGAFGVELLVEELDNGARKVVVTKLKNGPKGAEYGFKLMPVTLDVFEDKPVTSCVVEHCEVQESHGNGKRKLGDVERVVRDVIQDLTPIDGGKVEVPKVLDAAALKLPHEEGKRDQRKTRARRALEGLQSKNVVEIEADEVVLV